MRRGRWISRLVARVTLLSAAGCIALGTNTAASERLPLVEEVRALLAERAFAEAEGRISGASSSSDAWELWYATGLLQRARGDRDQAWESLARARGHSVAGTPSQRAELLRDTADLAFATGRSAEVTPLYLEAASAFEAAGLTHDQAGALRSSVFGRGYPDAAARQAARLRALTLIAGLDDHAPRHRYVRGALLHDLGDAAFGAGRYGWADVLYGAAEHLLAVDQDNRRALSLLLTSRGRMQRAHGYPERAIPFYERAAALQREVSYEPGLRQTLNAIGVTHQFLGDHAAALGWLQQSANLSRRLEQPEILAQQLFSMAESHALIGQQADAVALMAAGREALGSRSMSPLLRLTEARALLHVARPDDALPLADQAVGACADPHRRSELCADAFALRATVLARLGRLVDATGDVETAGRIWEDLWLHLSDDDGVRRGMGERAARVFHSEAIDLLQTAGQPLRALELSERARARAFLELLAQRRADREIESVGAALPRHAIVGAEYVRLVQQAVLESWSPEIVPPFSLSVGNPGDVRRTAPVNSSPLAIDDMRRVAREAEATILVYWVSRVATYAWAIGPDGRVTTHTAPIDAASLTALVDQVWPAADAPPSGRARTAMRSLHRLLVEPVLLPTPGIQRVVLVPHGVLGRLPFAALLDSSGRYLVERASLRYAPSVATLAGLQSDGPPGSLTALLVGDPGARRGGTHASSAAPSLAPLPGARVELTRVRGVLQQRDGQVDTLSGGAATEENVRARLERPAAVIHVAAHAIVSDALPMSSYIALSDSGSREAAAGRPDGDGRLTASEIHDLRLDADLVVLSTCRAAAGVPTGEGLGGLSRAFFAAGTSSVLASVWDLPDDTAAHLLPTFYDHWMRGADKADALRRAQTSLIERLRRGSVTVSTRSGPIALPEHHALWAGVILIGAR